MTLYGIPYQGSKTKIAPNIIALLPKGERFCDLFGGGFAMSHCARLSNKWGKVLYNELNALLPPLIQDALLGKYNYNRFKPQFVTREMFYERKDKDGYIRYIWSFGNSGKEYMFGTDLEPLKHEAHDFVVFGKPTQHFKQVERAVTSKDIHKRRLQFCGWFRAQKKRVDIERLERLEQLERLTRFDLQQLEQLEQRIEITSGSYEDYEHKDGDVVYCDPPYEGTADYGAEFDHRAFYEWVATRPYQVWFSSYKGIRDFKLVWAKQMRSSLGAGNSSINYECVYTNRG